MKPPCLVFEDEHLLVINKPAGLNTHSPSPFAGQGLYEWLRDREARWGNLAIIHRLDKETSGIILFSKTTIANRSLTEQFTNRAVRKSYLLLTDRAAPEKKLSVKTALVRAGDRYVSRPASTGADIAETNFAFLKHAKLHRFGSCALIEAEPLTGRTHQIRVHAADKGFAILGDTRYGGTAAPRLCLHAAEITIQHPASGAEIRFHAPADFDQEPGLALRHALISPPSNTLYRLIHGGSDAWPAWYVDRVGDYLLSQSSGSLTQDQLSRLANLVKDLPAQGAYNKRLSSRPQAGPRKDLSPQRVLGSSAPARFSVFENGLRFELSFEEGYSIGLFPDQRDNRRRLITGHVAAGFSLLEPQTSQRKPELLNTFAYTCGFSVYAAKAGWSSTNLDLSKKYLEWGKRNFVLNQIDPGEHAFIFGDVFEWLRRLRKRERRFDTIILDPPTFSQSKESGSFQAEKDYGKLVGAALPVLKPRGVLFACCNAVSWSPECFLAAVKEPIQAANRKILQEYYVPQPPDFPISRSEPAYLKTVWLRLG